MAAPRRAHARLYSAVLTLAAARPVEEISATEIAHTAGVHRSTFYEHAASPVELLRVALRIQLDRIREEHLIGGPDPIASTTRAVLAHIEEHSAIYERALLGSGGGDLRSMLSGHFHDSVVQLERSGAVRAPFDAPGSPARFLEESTARFIANGSIGILEAWLQEPAPRDPEHFLAALRGLATPLRDTSPARGPGAADAAPAAPALPPLRRLAE